MPQAFTRNFIAPLTFPIEPINSLPCLGVEQSFSWDFPNFSDLGWGITSLEHEIQWERENPGYWFVRKEQPDGAASFHVEPFAYELDPLPGEKAQERSETSPAFLIEQGSYRIASPFRDMKWLPSIDEEMINQERLIRYSSLGGYRFTR